MPEFGEALVPASVAAAASRKWRRAFFAMVGVIIVGGMLCAAGFNLLLSRFDGEHDILKRQDQTLNVADCNRKLQAQYNDTNTIATDAFLSGDRAAYDLLAKLRKRITQAQRDIKPNAPCPKV